jgi:predicted nucleic acid-binding protein
MIVLDTNVVSEALKPAPEPKVLGWLDNQLAETLYITAISYAELMVGIEMLPDGKRKGGLAASTAALLERLFSSRILSFDRAAAGQYALIYARTKKTGPISISDAQIAAIAAVQGFSVATRDVDPFRAAGLAVINPWE